MYKNTFCGIQDVYFLHIHYKYTLFIQEIYIFYAVFYAKKRKIGCINTLKMCFILDLKKLRQLRQLLQRKYKYININKLRLSQIATTLSQFCCNLSQLVAVVATLQLITI